MANSDRKINRGVRVGNKTYVPGQEDELAKQLDADEVKRLSDKGYLEGKWSGGAAKTETTPAKEAPEVDLNELTVAELKDRARDGKVEGFSTMKKDELVEALGG